MVTKEAGAESLKKRVYDVLIGHLEAEWIKDDGKFSQLRGEWNKLYEKSERACIFQSFTWNYTWWKHFGKGRELAILCIRENGELVGIAPMMVKRFLGVQIIEPIGLHEHLYFGFVDDRLRDDVPEALAQTIGEIVSQGVIHIPYVAAGSSEVDVFSSSLLALGWAEVRWVRAGSHYLVEEGSFDNYLAKKSRKARYNLKREAEKLEKTGKVRISEYAGKDLTEEIVQRAGKVQKRSWLWKRGQEAIDNAFYREVIPTLGMEQAAEMFFLSIEGKDSAYVLNFKSKGKNYCMFIGFDEEYVELSPGKALMSACLEKVLNRGDNVYDFLYGDGEYKRFWSNRTRRIMRVVIYKGIGGWTASWIPYRLHGKLAKYRVLKTLVGKARRTRKKVDHYLRGVKLIRALRISNDKMTI